jgi:universal stress protein A
MKKYQHLLIASDITPDSLEICRRAKKMADALDAKLSILHVVEPAPLLYGGGEFVIPMDMDIENSLAQEAQSSLNKVSQLLDIPKREQWVVIGNKREEIIKMIQEHHIDLLVVGGHDRHGLALLLPTTTDTVVHAMPCDILIVRIDSAE